MRRAARASRREFVSSLTLAGTAGLAGVRAEAAPAVARRQTISFEGIVDLTHTLTPEFPFIPVPGITFPFSKTAIATIENMGWPPTGGRFTNTSAPRSMRPPASSRAAGRWTRSR